MVFKEGHNKRSSTYWFSISIYPKKVRALREGYNESYHLIRFQSLLTLREGYDLFNFLPSLAYREGHNEGCHLIGFLPLLIFEEDHSLSWVEATKSC
jgi:hypothetical protein